MDCPNISIAVTITRKSSWRKCPLAGFLPTRISPGKRRWETYAVLPYVVEVAYRIALSYTVLGSKESDQLKLRGGCNEYDS
jgi:hypothetical protein